MQNSTQTTNQILGQEAFQYGEIQRGCSNAKLNGHLQLTKLSQSKIELSYMKSHHAALQKYMTHIGVNCDNKRLINKLYKRSVTPDNIIKLYPNPMQIFFGYLIEGNLSKLINTSCAVFSPKISDLTKSKI